MRNHMQGDSRHWTPECFKMAKTEKTNKGSPPQWSLLDAMSISIRVYGLGKSYLGSLVAGL